MTRKEDEESIITSQVEEDSREEPESSTSSSGHHDQSIDNEVIFKLSKRRWLVLFGICTYGAINGVSDQLAPILNVILNLLSFTDLRVFTWITSSSSYIPLITTLPTAWLVDKWGLKYAAYAGVVLTLVRNGFRALMFLPDLPFWINLRYVYWMIAHILNLQGVTLFFCLPLKVSESWFKESERFTAWALMLIANDLASAITAYLLPIYITGRDNIHLLAYVNIIAALVLTIVIPLCIRESRPPNPPSHRIMKSDSNTIPYLTGVKIVLTNKDYLVHLIYATFSASVIGSIGPIIQDILDASGYDNHFCGLLISVTSLGGVVFLFVSSYSVIIFKNSVIGCKVLACLTTIGFLLFLYSTQMEGRKLMIIGVSLLSSLLRSLSSPMFQNMSVHLCSGLVREATISGLGITLIYIFSSIYSLLVVYMRTQVGDHKFSYTESMKFLSISAVAITTIYVLFFNGRPPKERQSHQEPQQSES